MRKKDIAKNFGENPTVIEAIKSFGVPHGEIELVLVNGKSVKLSHKLKNDDRVSIYPIFELLDVSKVSQIKSVEGDLKFLADVHLGGLAKFLRMVGIDTDLLKEKIPAGELAKSDRIVLTRNRNILPRKDLKRVLFVRATDPKKQLQEVIRRLGLKEFPGFLSRCMECNTILTQIAKAEVMDRLPQGVKELHQDFFICPICDKIYWEGTHVKNMKKFLIQFLKIEV